jgi:hypothetical protein
METHVLFIVESGRGPKNKEMRFGNEARKGEKNMREGMLCATEKKCR